MLHQITTNVKMEQSSVEVALELKSNNASYSDTKISKSCSSQKLSRSTSTSLPEVLKKDAESKLKCNISEQQHNPSDSKITQRSLHSRDVNMNTKDMDTIKEKSSVHSKESYGNGSRDTISTSSDITHDSGFMNYSGSVESEEGPQSITIKNVKNSSIIARNINMQQLKPFLGRQSKIAKVNWSKINPVIHCRRKASSSELAGQRLYNLALQRINRLTALGKKTDEKNEQNNKLIVPGIGGERLQQSVSEVATSRLYTQALERKTRLSALGGKQNPKRNEKTKKVNVSKLAGERLHLQAMERKRRLAELKKKAENISPKLNLATGTYPPPPPSAPVFVRLNEHAKSKHRLKEAENTSVTKKVFNPKSNPINERLYALSEEMQAEGKKRREGIIIARENAKWVPPPPPKVIPVANITRLYREGMQYLIAREKRRTEDYNQMSTNHG